VTFKGKGVREKVYGDGKLIGLGKYEGLRSRREKWEGVQVRRGGGDRRERGVLKTRGEVGRFVKCFQGGMRESEGWGLGGSG